MDTSFSVAPRARAHHEAGLLTARNSTVTRLGIVRVCTSPGSYDECALSALSIRELHPDIEQHQFFADGCEQASSSIFAPGTLERAVSQTSRLYPAAGHSYIFGWGNKLHAWLQSPFDVTIGLDCDVVVVHRAFVPNLAAVLSQGADIAWAYDWPLWMQRLVPPMPCAAILAWRNPMSVSHLFRHAISAYRNGSAPREWRAWHARARPNIRMRWSDQEALYWAFGAFATRLRATVVPSEAYLCARQEPRVSSATMTCLAVHTHTHNASCRHAAAKSMKSNATLAKSTTSTSERERGALLCRAREAKYVRQRLPFTSAWLHQQVR